MPRGYYVVILQMHISIIFGHFTLKVCKGGGLRIYQHSLFLVSSKVVNANSIRLNVNPRRPCGLENNM